MNINISANAAELGISAAKFVTEKLKDAIKKDDEARWLFQRAVLTNEIPSTMLKQHNDYHLYVDHNSMVEVVVF